MKWWCRHDKYILANIGFIIEELRHMASQLDTITSKLDALESAEDQVLTLLDETVAALQAAKNDPAAIQAIADRLDADRQKIADAIARDTPSTVTGGGGNDTPAP